MTFTPRSVHLRESSLRLLDIDLGDEAEELSRLRLLHTEERPHAHYSRSLQEPVSNTTREAHTDTKEAEEVGIGQATAGVLLSLEHHRGANRA